MATESDGNVTQDLTLAVGSALLPFQGQDWCLSLGEMLGDDPVNPTTEDGLWWVGSAAGPTVFELAPLCARPFVSRLEFRVPEDHSAGDAISLLVSTTWRYALDLTGGAEIRMRMSPPTGSTGGAAFLSLSPIGASGFPSGEIVSVLGNRDGNIFGVETDETPSGQYVDPNTDPYDPEGDDAWIRLVFEDAVGGGNNHVYLYTSGYCGEWTERFDAEVSGDIDRMEVAVLMQSPSGESGAGAGFVSEIIVIPGAES